MQQHQLSISGVGYVTAAGFLGEVEDISKYRNFKEIIKLAGLNLVEISGIKKGEKEDIQKRKQILKTISLPVCKSGHG